MLSWLRNLLQDVRPDELDKIQVNLDELVERVKAVRIPGPPECAYCHEAVPGTRSRHHPDLGDEDGILLCRACWLDVQRRFTCPHM